MLTQKTMQSNAELVSNAVSHNSQNAPLLHEPLLRIFGLPIRLSPPIHYARIPLVYCLDSFSKHATHLLNIHWTAERIRHGEVVDREEPQGGRILLDAVPEQSLIFPIVPSPQNVEGLITFTVWRLWRRGARILHL